MDGEVLVDDELAKSGDSDPGPFPEWTRWKAEFFPLPIRFGSGGGDEFSLEDIGCSSYLLFIVSVAKCPYQLF